MLIASFVFSFVTAGDDGIGDRRSRELTTNDAS